MKCPYCLEPTEVKDSRPCPGDAIRRRRECANKHRFTTWESLERPIHANLQRQSKTQLVAMWKKVFDLVGGHTHMPEAEGICVQADSSSEG